MNKPLLSVNNLTHLYAPGKGFSDVSFDLWPGEVLGIVGESGSGKTTLLKSISARLTPQQGEIHYENRSLYAMSEADRRRLLRTEWGVVHQHPLDGLRRQVSAGGNIGERLMATGARHYGDIRATAQKWLEEVEIPANRIDDLPTTFSGGMQQRLQIARNLVTHQAFAADVDWDGSDGAVIVIPDEVHGYKVTALGGYIGRGVPTAFALNAPEIWNTQVVFGDEKVAADAEKDYPNAKIVDCTVTLRLGRNVKALNEVSCFGWQGYDENGAETVWRLRWNVECDEGNETFYAKGGRLYRCADGEAVEAFRCA